jgi:hypothetical protein
MTTLYELLNQARVELKELAIDNFDESFEVSDEVYQIADSSVPVYTWDILQLAADNLDLALNEPELGPAFDGSPTPTNIIAANIYEAVVNDLYEYWNDELEAEFNELAESV